MHNIKQVLEFSINLSKKKKNTHYPELNSQSFSENGAIIQLPNNVAYVDIIMHRKGKFSMDGALGTESHRATRQQREPLVLFMRVENRDISILFQL